MASESTATGSENLLLVVISTRGRVQAEPEKCNEYSIRALSWVLESTHEATVLDRGSNHRTGATEPSRVAQSRYGSAGELLAWLPIVTGHEGLGWCVRWDNTRPLTVQV